MGLFVWLFVFNVRSANKVATFLLFVVADGCKKIEKRSFWWLQSLDFGQGSY